MSNIYEIKRCLGWIKKFHNKIIILYCVSGYPTTEKDLNLNSIDVLKKKFKNNLIGLSDHTNDIYSSLAASTKNISIIEKHFIIDNKKTTDSSFSINPSQLKSLSDGLNKMKNVFGKKKFFVKKIERVNIKYKRSIYAKTLINKGQIIKNKNLITFRPKIGISASELQKVVNKRSKRLIKKNSPIFYTDIL